LRIFFLRIENLGPKRKWFVLQEATTEAMKDKYENSTLKIYIRTIKNYTDIDPTVDFVFPVNKIDRKNSGKIVIFVYISYSFIS
jgi:hypothetical protein